MKAVGITCGIGSMLVGARQAGFKVVGNVEWRRYYHAEDEHGRNTFTENFPGADFHYNIDSMSDDDVAKFMGADLALGHPECGNFSTLCGVNKGHTKLREEPSDIPLFVDLIKKLRPRFFVMDDLPRAFVPFPMVEYAKRLPDYDLFPELVSNWGYGNVQKHRNRLFMIGAQKRERWVFRPGESVQSGRTLESVIGDLPAPRHGSNYPNHDPTALDEKAQKMLGFKHPDDPAPTWREFIAYLKKNGKQGESLEYYSKDGGVLKKKPGCKIEYWDSERGTSVQDGGSYKIHPIRFDNLTIRERARIQGFPDDFVFYGTRLNAAGEYQPTANAAVVKQTGKAMPVQFCAYVSKQIAAHIRGEEFSSTGQRVLPPNEHVDGAKMWFCENVGYSNQSRACGACWLYDRCTIRMRKYRIGEPARGQRDLMDPGVVPGPDAETAAKCKRSGPRPPAAAPTGPRAARPRSGGDLSQRHASRARSAPAVKPSGPSPLRGRRVGVTKRTDQYVRSGVPTEDILHRLRAEFPGTRANRTDVAKARARVKAEAARARATKKRKRRVQ